MAAPARTNVVLPDGKTMILSKDNADVVRIDVLQDGDLVDLTNYTITASANLDTTSKTVTVAKEANQTTTGKGRILLTIPAAAVDAEGTLYVDVKVQESGGPTVIASRLQWTVSDSEAS